MSAVGPWQEPLVDIVVRDHVVTDSAVPQFETMQMRCCVMRSVEAIYRENIQREMAQTTVQVYCLWYCMLYHVDPSIFKLLKRKSTTELGSNVAE